MMATSFYLLILSFIVAITNSFVVVNTNTRPATRFVSSSIGSSSSSSSHEDDLDSSRSSLEKLFQQDPAPRLSIDEVESSLGMPWKSSIDPKVSASTNEDEDLLYMPFWEWQMSFMKENLTNLRVQPCTDGKTTDFSYNENTNKKARIVNLCASSDEYRKIRMTYYDAGDNTQVFNSVWYPDPAYNLPVLGIDLLAFNRKKYLAIVDFQPLHTNEDDHAKTYEHILKPIKEQYETLKGRMSSKFYDETQFFSQEMLFARFDDEGIVNNDLFPAFQSYVQAHLELVQSTKPEPSQAKFVMNRQKEYDTYSAERDPATGLFAAMFGAEWADDFVHKFLFSMSEKSKNPPSASMPFVGGGPPSPSIQQKQPSSQKQVKQEQVRR